MPKKCLFRLVLIWIPVFSCSRDFSAVSRAKNSAVFPCFWKIEFLTRYLCLKKHPCQIFIYYAKKVFVSVGIESLYGFNDFSALSCQKFGQKKSFWKIEPLLHTLFGLKNTHVKFSFIMQKKCLFRLELKAYMDLMTLVHFLAKNSAKKKVFEKLNFWHVIWPKKTPMSNFHLLCKKSVCFGWNWKLIWI